MRLFTAFLLLAVATSAHGQEDLSTKGDINCAEWRTMRRIDGMAVAEPYAIGFMNGLVAGSGVNLWDEPSPMQPDQLWRYIDQHCGRNPLDNVTDAIYAMAMQRVGREVDGSAY